MVTQSEIIEQLKHLHDFAEDNLGQLQGLKLIFSDKKLSAFIPRKIKNEKLSNCYYGIAQHYHYKQQYAKMTGYLFKSLCFNPFSSNTKSKIYLIVKHFPEMFTKRNPV